MTDAQVMQCHEHAGNFIRRYGEKALEKAREKRADDAFLSNGYGSAHWEGVFNVIRFQLGHPIPR